MSRIRTGSDRVVCGVVALSAFAALAGGQEDIRWVAPVSGLWSDAANWTGPGVPGQVGNKNVRAVIDLAGSYTVQLDFDAVLVGLEVTGSGATLNLAGSRLTAAGQNVFTGASFTGDMASTFRTRGVTVFSGGASLAGLGMIDLGGATEFDDGDIDLCDTCVFMTGSGVWNGTGAFRLLNDGIGSEFVIDSGGSFDITGTGSRAIEGVGANNRFINRGELRVDLANASDTFEIDGATFQNSAGAKVRVDRGLVRTDLVGTLSGSSLRGGDWFIGDAGTVDAAGVAIDAIDVDVTLSGASSSFDALDTLESISANGAFRVTDGKSFTTDASVAAFTVGGALEVGAGSSFGMAAALTNLSAGTLTGGSFIVGGALELAPGSVIETLEASLTLDGSGAIRSAGGGDDLLAGLSSVGASGAFALRNGAAFVTAGDLALAGSIEVGRGSSLDVRGDLGAFSGGTFAGGSIRVGGDLIADNARVQRVEGSLTVGRDARLLARDGGSLVDGLSFLEQIRVGGTLNLTDGRDLSIVANTVSVEGSLVLGSTSSGADALLGSVLQVDAISFAESGTLTTEIGSLTNFGRIEANSAAFLGAGPSLTLVLADGYSAALGDRFLLIEAATISGVGFADLTVLGELGEGLFFEVFLDASGAGVVVVPAPGAGGCMVLGLAAAVRRRRR